MHQESHDHSHSHDHEHQDDHGHENSHGGDHGHHHHHDHDHHHHDHDHHQHRGWTPGPGFYRSLKLLLAIALLSGLVYSSFFAVDETEYAYVTSFGKPERLCEPGLGFKWPFQAIHRFDRRLQMLNPPGSQMLTREKSNSDQNEGHSSIGGPPLTVEWYACWRVPSQRFLAEQLLWQDQQERPAEKHLSEEEIHATIESRRDDIHWELEQAILRFFSSVGSIAAAGDRLRERIDSMLKAEVGKMTLSKFVSLEQGDIKIDSLTTRLTRNIRDIAIRQFGIEVVDVRIKRFNHPEGVKPAIFDMIRTERYGVAEKYRAEGKSKAVEVRSKADLERSQIHSKATYEAEVIRGEGEAQAMRIANAAHSKDEKFYQLLKTLDTYRVILNEKTTVVLSANSNLLRLLTGGVPNLATQPDSSLQPTQAGDSRTPGISPASNGDQETGP